MSVGSRKPETRPPVRKRAQKSQPDPGTEGDRGPHALYSSRFSLVSDPKLALYVRFA